MKAYIRLLSLGAILVLGACSTHTLVAPAALIFAAEGRLSLVARPAAAEPRQISGRFVWTETQDTTQIDWLGPLGETQVRLKVGALWSELQSNQGTETATSPEQLLQNYFGASLPLAGLRFWLRGQDKSGQRRAPQTFEEDGWRMEYTQMSADQSGLPRILRMQRVLPEQGATLEIRLVIDQWQL
jgi:outer membrane lipoprotein LolB